jgi:Tol biopolymer transport system component
MAIAKDRIVLPRHFLDSDIVLSDGSVIAATEDLEFEPAASPDGKLVAYTIEKDNKFEIWTASIDGKTPAFRTLGREARFSPNGFQIVYTHTGIEGRVDLRKVDIRDGSSETLTDAAEIDFQADWSPDGRTIAFASGRGETVGLWSLPAAGGKRLRVYESGYFPRFLPDGRSLLFWNQGGLWTVGVDGQSAHKVRENLPEPVPAVWVKGGPKTYEDPEIHGGKQVWPRFDILPDGRVVTAPIEVREASLWAVNLTYVKK